MTALWFAMIDASYDQETTEDGTRKVVQPESDRENLRRPGHSDGFYCEKARHEKTEGGKQQSRPVLDAGTRASKPTSAVHRADSIAARIWRTLPFSPTKIASPIRKWPMLSSTTCGIAATGTTLS